MFDIETTKHLAILSKIEFTDNELIKMTDDMSDIIHIIDKVREFNESNCIDNPSAVDYNDLRNDICSPSSQTSEIISNAKKVKGNSFVVPKIV